jgi:hypothetical protein
MNRQHGYKGDILADPADPTGTTAVTLASMNGWTLDLSRERADVTAFQDPNHVFVQGLPIYKGTVSGWWDTDDMTIFDIALGDTACGLKLVPSTLTPTFLFKGPAFLDSSIDVKASGGIALSGTFDAAGAWSREPIGVMAARTPLIVPAAGVTQS